MADSTSFNANNFRQNLKGDVARPNLFKCNVTFPLTLGNLGAKAAKQFAFTCRSAQLPGMQTGQIHVPYFGRMVKFVGDRQFEDFAVRVINDEGYVVREAFEAWQNDLDIVNHDSTRKEIILEDNDRANHYAQVTVTHFSKGGLPIKTYTLHNAFPYVVEGIGLDWQENDTAMEFGVVFAYDFFTIGKSGPTVAVGGSQLGT